jgi:hypothetical protein
MRINLSSLLLAFFFNFSNASIIQQQLNSLILDEGHVIATFYRLETIYNSISSPLDETIFSTFVEKNYYPLVRNVLNSNSRDFVDEMVNSNIVFQMFICRLDLYATPPKIFFKILREDIPLFKNMVEECFNKIETESQKWEKKYWSMRAIEFVEIRINVLLRKPLDFMGWNDRKEIIKLYTKFLRNMKNLIYPGEKKGGPRDDISIEISKYEFLLDKISITNDNQINFYEFTAIYNEVKNIDPKSEMTMSPEVKPKESDLKSAGLLTYIFSIYSLYFFSSKSSQLNVFSEFDTKFLCLSIIAAYRLEYLVPSSLLDKISIDLGDKFKSLHQEFQSPLSKLIKEALNIVASDIREEFKSASNKWASIRKETRFSSPSVTGFLRNYIDGSFDINKLKVKVYLHLLRLRRTSSENLKKL